MSDLTIPEGLKLNYGCGRDYIDGFINVDHSIAVKADVHGTLSDVYSLYGDNRFAFVLLKHVFEHISDPMNFMEELYTLCQPDALVEIFCPYYTSIDAWADPDHKRAISESSFIYFDRSAYLWVPNNPITPAHNDQFLPNCDFQTVMTNYSMPEYINKTQVEQEYARKHLMNVVMEIQVILKCIKPAREEI